MVKFVRQYFPGLIFCIGVSGLFAANAQTNLLPVERSFRKYKRALRQHPYLEMVELKSRVPSIIYDLRYAGECNFMQRPMYPAGTNTTFLRQPVADALQKVQEVLKKEGLGLKIFDAYRPYSISKLFWDLVKDERYVANPARGSNHNRGTAIDLTLVDLRSGNELDMGTGFDNFSDTAHHDFEYLPLPVLYNREKLKTIMSEFGFAPLTSEWWHYTYQSDLQFDVLDISFEKLSRQ